MTTDRSAIAVVLAAVVMLAGQVALFGPAAEAQPATQSTPVLRLEITSLDPRIVTERSQTLEVAFRVTNESLVPVRGISARLDFGEPQTTPDDLGQALVAKARTDSQHTPFEPVADNLEPGESTDFEITADLRGSAEGGVLFTRTGVYPMLVNLNGMPQDGIEARLASVHLLLPVASVPGGQDTEPPEDPRPVSVLWPIASDPRVVSAPYGGTLLLSDDGIADEMRPGGRLDALVTAADSALGSADLRSSLCFAIDPEVVATAQAMTSGYRVVEGRGTAKGSGAEDAKDWLEALRAVVADRCVITMPYADADLTATADASESLAEEAAGSDDVIESVLEVRPRDDALWPTGALTLPAVDAAAAAGKKVLVSSPTAVGHERPLNSPVGLTAGDDESAARATVIPYDALTSLALAPASADPDVAHNSTVAADQRESIATQNGVATLMFHAGLATERPEDPLLVAPPRQWAATQAELRWLLSNVDRMMSAGLLAPGSPADLLDATATDTVRPAAADPREPAVPPEIRDRVAGLDASLSDIADAMAVDPVAQVDPSEVVTPIRRGLLRVMSTTWRDETAGRDDALSDAEAQLDDLRGAVRITDPGRAVTLASNSSPIPVSISNDLPVVVTVRVVFSPTVGLRPADVGDVSVKGGAVQSMRIPAEALRAGRFAVDVALTTPDGTELGAATRFEITSTEYSAITVIVTATAAGILLLLSGRRVYRRLKSDGKNR